MQRSGTAAGPRGGSIYDRPDACLAPKVSKIKKGLIITKTIRLLIHNIYKPYVTLYIIYINFIDIFSVHSVYNIFTYTSIMGIMSIGNLYMCRK